MTTAPASDPPLLILDLDETLIHAAADPQPHLPPPDFHIGAYPVWKRPGVDAFVATVCAWFQVAVWTSASAAYAQTVVTHLTPHPNHLLFVWSRSRCTQRWDSESGTLVWHKNLTKVTRTFRVPLERILIVDDSPEKLARHYGNHVPIRPFVGDPDDTELPSLLPFLDRLRTAPNVRLIEKRGWQASVHPAATESSPNSALKPTT